MQNTNINLKIIKLIIVFINNEIINYEYKKNLKHKISLYFYHPKTSLSPTTPEFCFSTLVETQVQKPLVYKELG